MNTFCRKEIESMKQIQTDSCEVKFFIKSLQNWLNENEDRQSDLEDKIRISNHKTKTLLKI